MCACKNWVEFCYKPVGYVVKRPPFIFPITDPLQTRQRSNYFTVHVIVWSRQGTINLTGKSRQGSNYLTGLSRQGSNYLTGQSRQIAFPKIKSLSLQQDTRSVQT